MGQVSTKLRRFTSRDGWNGEGFCHWCPACEEMHAFAVSQPFSNGAKWTFDNNFYQPTFAPSMNIRVGPFTCEGGLPQIDVCHYFLRDGNIQFLQDCTHKMAGQTVPLPDLPDHFWDTDFPAPIDP